MKNCSVCENMEIVPGTVDDYRRLGHYHYRDKCPGPVAAIYVLKINADPTRRSGILPVGVIVYSMPIPEVELRNVAIGDFLSGLDKSTQLGLINKHIRCITRLIIDPRYRGLGLASWLVRETMPRMRVAIIEAMAVMGLVSPFLERAGMTAYVAKTPVRTVRLLEALSSVGVEGKTLVDPERAQRQLDRLGPSKARFVEFEIRRFLQSYSRRRDMAPGLERTEYVLTKLTTRPVYYIWFNPGTRRQTRGKAAD